MVKITFMGAGSTVFVRNVLGDCMYCEALRDSEFALYDIDEQRLEESFIIMNSMNETINEGRAKITKFCGVEERKDALRDANYIVNAIQVGLYDPCTIIDFEIPKKYGVEQTIADTLGIGGIMRALRTIPVLKDFAKDIEEVCPDAWFINYTNPMAMLTGYMQRYTNVKTIGICHSVQNCAKQILSKVGMDEYIEGHREHIAGINHMGWLLKLEDKDGNDLYPEVRRRTKEKNATEKHYDMIRFEYVNNFGYYCTESSEHNSEYNPYYIKSKYPELIERYNIPLDEYPRRCVNQIAKWNEDKANILSGGHKIHERSIEYASYIMEALTTGEPYFFGGNVINNGLIENLVDDACVEVTCVANANGITPIPAGKLPVQLACMNMSNINPQLMTIQAAVSQKKEDIYLAAMFDPHTGAELSIDDIKAMVDELCEAHGEYMKDYK